MVLNFEIITSTSAHTSNNLLSSCSYIISSIRQRAVYKLMSDKKVDDVLFYSAGRSTGRRENYRLGCGWIESEWFSICKALANCEELTDYTENPEPSPGVTSP